VNCPKCGRFLGLYFAEEVGKDLWESVFWWSCTNPDCYGVRPEYAIAAPAYDWLYWYKYIPKEDLELHPDLKREWEQAKVTYKNRRK